VKALKWSIQIKRDFTREQKEKKVQRVKGYIEFTMRVKRRKESNLIKSQYNP
jgi:hypothetical protein